MVNIDIGDAGPEHMLAAQQYGLGSILLIIWFLILTLSERAGNP